jgi:hypothetical protein
MALAHSDLSDLLAALQAGEMTLSAPAWGESSNS